ncbi:MAG: hypothetical protein A2X84_13155 [Desulfuromonadaceae bacterium GWC2_58_13]|nr:MAG: hypothetical protein A2X84_13155 [Desulfuromonadaceae bacterium GWC2_58_13]
MKKLLVVNLLLFALMVGAFVPSAEALTANNLDDLGMIYDDYFGQESGSVEVNGQTIFWFVDTLNNTTTLEIGDQIFDHIDIFNRQEVLLLIAEVLGIPLTSAGALTEPTSASATTSRLVFTELVVPTVQTATEQQRTEAQKAQGGVRTFGGTLRTEWVDKAGPENGRVSGFNLGLAYDVDNYTFGLILPYDYFDFDSFTANRIGAIFFGQYHLGISEELEATFTGNLNYMFTDFSILGQDDDLNTYGGGLSAGLRYSQEAYELGCGISYQYNQDDVDLDDDDQHLIKTGANIGFHLTPNQVVNLFGIWTYDATDYKYDYGDTDYFEIGTEYRANLSETWAMNIGYRKVVDLEDFDSDMVYLGTAWQF